MSSSLSLSSSSSSSTTSPNKSTHLNHDTDDDADDEDADDAAAAATALMRDVSEFTLAKPGAGETFLVHVLQQMWGGLSDIARDR